MKQWFSRTGGSCTLLLCGLLVGVVGQPYRLAADPPAAASLEKSSQTFKGKAFELKYRFAPGEEVLSKVLHLVTIDTKIQGTAETAETRSVSHRRWKVTGVDERGNITFLHYIDKANMWQKISGRPEIRFESDSDAEPHPLYRKVAETIGISLATITISPQGVIVGRENAQPHFNPGIGELTIPLPDRPVRIGQRWYIPNELRIAGADGRYKRIQTRQLYTLQKVQAAVATITVATQVLTPIEDPKIRSKLIQRLQHGTIKFDVEAGRVRSKQMDLNERVIGFNGPASMMHYLTRFTEEWSTGKKTSKRVVRGGSSD